MGLGGMIPAMLKERKKDIEEHPVMSFWIDIIFIIIVLVGVGFNIYGCVKDEKPEPPAPYNASQQTTPKEDSDFYEWENDGKYTSGFETMDEYSDYYYEDEPLTENSLRFLLKDDFKDFLKKYKEEKELTLRMVREYYRNKQ